VVRIGAHMNKVVSSVVLALSLLTTYTASADIIYAVGSHTSNEKVNKSPIIEVQHPEHAAKHNIQNVCLLLSDKEASYIDISIDVFNDCRFSPGWSHGESADGYVLNEEPSVVIKEPQKNEVQQFVSRDGKDIDDLLGTHVQRVAGHLQGLSSGKGFTGKASFIANYIETNGNPSSVGFSQNTGLRSTASLSSSFSSVKATIASLNNDNSLPVVPVKQDNTPNFVLDNNVVKPVVNRIVVPAPQQEQDNNAGGNNTGNNNQPGNEQPNVQPAAGGEQGANLPLAQPVNSGVVQDPVKISEPSSIVLALWAGLALIMVRRKKLLNK